MSVQTTAHSTDFKAWKTIASGSVIGDLGHERNAQLLLLFKFQDLLYRVFFCLPEGLFMSVEN